MKLELFFSWVVFAIVLAVLIYGLAVLLLKTIYDIGKELIEFYLAQKKRVIAELEDELDKSADRVAGKMSGKTFGSH